MMAALLAAHAAPPSRCPTCRGPVWSWATVPIFFHSSEPGGPRGGFTDLELDTIARFFEDAAVFVLSRMWFGVLAGYLLRLHAVSYCGGAPRCRTREP